MENEPKPQEQTTKKEATAEVEPNVKETTVDSKDVKKISKIAISIVAAVFMFWVSEKAEKRFARPDITEEL